MLRALQGSQHSTISQALDQVQGCEPPAPLPTAAHSSSGASEVLSRSLSTSSFGSATESSLPSSGHFRFNDENRPPELGHTHAQHCPKPPSNVACSPAAAELLNSYSSLSAHHVQPQEASKLGKALPRKPRTTPVHRHTQNLPVSDPREAIGAVWRRQLSNPIFTQPGDSEDAAEPRAPAGISPTGQLPLRSNPAVEEATAPRPTTAHRYPASAHPEAAHAHAAGTRQLRLPARQHQNPAFEPQPRKALVYPAFPDQGSLCQLSSAYSSALASTFPELHSNPAFEASHDPAQAQPDSTPALEIVPFSSLAVTPHAKTHPTAADPLPSQPEPNTDSFPPAASSPTLPAAAPANAASRCPCPPSSPTSQGQQQASEAARSPLKELQLSMYGSPQVSARRHHRSGNKSALGDWLLSSDPGHLAGSVASTEWHSILSTDPTGMSLKAASSGAALPGQVTACLAGL